MRTQAQGPGRLVQDSSYYVGILSKKIRDVTSETQRLRSEIEQQSKDNAQYSTFERKYESLLKTKETLEGQLADYNLALDKTRTSTDPEDVQRMAEDLKEKNRQSAQELDRIFLQRKQKDSEAAQIEDQLANHYKQIEKRINELEPGKLRSYNELINSKKDMESYLSITGSKLNEINGQIHAYENDDRGVHSYRKDYEALEKQVTAAARDEAMLQEELEIAGLDPKEGLQKFKARVEKYKEANKSTEENIGNLRGELTRLQRMLDDFGVSADQGGEDEEAAKFELLKKRDADMTAFMEKFDESKAEIIGEQRSVQSTIVALLEYISRDVENSKELPTQEAHGEMEAIKDFKQKNLLSAEKTMETLQAEHRKREKELDILRNSEPKLKKEMEALRAAIAQLKKESDTMADVAGLRQQFDATKGGLMDISDSYTRRKQDMQQQVLVLSQKLDVLKKEMSTNETVKELDEMEKQMKNKEKNIFELRDYVETKSRETDYEGLKASCLKNIEILNAAAVKENARSPAFGQQAKW